MKFLSTVFSVICLFSFGACSKKSEPPVETSGGHVHAAPHGGTLIPLGDHAYNLELVRDDAAGKLAAYVLDGHAENFVRITSPSIELVAMPGGKYTPVLLNAVANPATGETVGNTSHFEADAEWLKTAGGFAGIVTVEIRGTTFKQVSYELHK